MTFDSSLLLLMLSGTFLVGRLVENVICFNPLLTYTLRFQKLTFYPNISGNYTINSYGGNEFINGFITINSKKPIDKVVADFHRCNPEGFDCEYFQSWTFTDLCQKSRERNQMWSNFYGSFDPPMVCPFDKINYRMKNFTLELSQLMRWYPDVVDYQWKIVQKFYAGDVYVGGVKKDFSIFAYRKRNNRILPIF